MTFAERKANSSESFSWDSDHHVDCYRNNDSFEWMPKVWKRYTKPMRLDRRNCCEVRKNGFLNKRINNQKAITDGETESKNKCIYIETVITFFRFYTFPYFLIWNEFVFQENTYMTSKVLKPLFPRLRRNMNIDNKFPNSPKIPTTKIATPSSQNFALSLILS